MNSRVSLLGQRLRLSPSVSLRQEPFGALAYHFGNRRLTFLKRPELVTVVMGLDGRRTVREVLEQCGIPESQWQAYDNTFEKLIGADMLHDVTREVFGG